MQSINHTVFMDKTTFCIWWQNCCKLPYDNVVYKSKKSNQEAFYCYVNHILSTAKLWKIYCTESTIRSCTAMFYVLSVLCSQGSVLLTSLCATNSIFHGFHCLIICLQFLSLNRIIVKIYVCVCSGTDLLLFSYLFLVGYNALILFPLSFFFF